MNYPLNDNYKDLGNRIVAYTPKVASTSLNQALRFKRLRQPIAAQRKRDGTPIWLFIREWQDRLVSGFWQFNKSPRSNPKVPQRFEQFAEFVMTEKGREHFYANHWIPQTEYHSYQGIILPDVYFKFDQINELWPKLFPGITLSWRNPAKTGRPVTDEAISSLLPDLKARLDEYFAQDQAAYDTAYGSVVELADTLALEASA